MTLKTEADKAGEALTVYSFRHGYALRCHETGLIPRVSAALMAHSLQTHSLHYGCWTDAETIQAALARTTATQQIRHAEASSRAAI